MIRRLLLAAAPVLAALVIGGPAQGASSEPAWSVHYRFGTILYGGTSFDLDANGRYTLIASSMRFPRSERDGTLAPPEIAAFARLVAAARTATWSSAYGSYHYCAEHYSSLRLARTQERGPDDISVRWTCGLPGVPADLRALILAVRAQITGLVLDAQIDTTPALEATPVASHDAIALVSGDGTRSVSIAADGTIVSRRRIGVGLFPLADCPPRALGAVDANALAKLHALQTPTADVFLGTSRETGEIFEQAMADCGTPAGYGCAAPEFVVPRGTRWVLKVTRNDTAGVVVLDLDDAGRAFARRKNGEPTRPMLARGTLAELDRLVTRAHDDRWPATFAGPLACEQIVQITHVAAGGERTNGPPIDGPCDAARAPGDAAALFRFIGERVVPELAPPS
jgi:hypothetical protein